VGFHRYSFPGNQQANIIIDMTHAIYNFKNKVVWAYVRVVNDSLLLGYRQTTGWAKNRKIFFAIAFSKPFDSFGYVRGDKEHYYFRSKNKYISGRGVAGRNEMFGKELKTCFNFKTKGDESLLIKVALSGVDMAGALKNLETEIPHWDFEKTKKDTKDRWDEELNEIIIEGSRKEKEIFYTALYHTLLAPMTYGDVDNRYRGCDQQIHKAYNFTPYTTFSLWDTYRAAHPLYTIIKRERVSDMVKSMVAHFQQSPDGILPIWPFHGNETWCMIGYHSAAVIADAYLKGIRDYDVQKAYQAIKSTATHRDYDGLGHYMDLGYVPIDKEPEAVSKTLEYAYDDYVIALMAKELGKTEDFKAFSKRALNYRHLYDRKTYFMRAKKSDGTWRIPFDPFLAKYGGDYTEGNAWQYTWYVPHDVQGLISLMGGRKNFIKRLDKLFVLETEEEKYASVDDISGLIGQYAHGNEPSQHIAYLYNYAGVPYRTQERINQIMNGLFDNTPDGICGNEDCGQMSAWYIFSSLGFYPVCPGDGTYEIGKPNLKKATIYLAKGKTFVIEAKNLSKRNIYIQSARLNGKDWNKSYILHKDIMKGGNLVFKMGAKPHKKWGASPTSQPPSLSRQSF
jgi:predicted alpha-1,2-mannosidase